jgi:hypothetical protein
MARQLRLLPEPYRQIALGFDGIFRVIEGQDAVSPVVPADDTGSAVDVPVEVPPYTLVDANGVPTTVVLTTFDHKRFTMQDLSKMDDRVAHLEYYTALNSLERITRDQSIEDASGNERFKNGILVDSFHGSDVADVSRTDYTASIDQQNRELHTGFRTFVLQFAPDVANSTSSASRSSATWRFRPTRKNRSSRSRSPHTQSASIRSTSPASTARSSCRLR